MLLYALFFLSGAAALIYQVLWLKELGLVFGNTAYAAATTLAVFFLGLAAGSWAAGRRAARLANPLRAYALLELGIAAAALLYFALTPAVRAAYGATYPLWGQNLAAMSAVKLLLATALLFPAAFLMGGTLPVMGQHLIRRPTELGRTGTLLYLVNTAGAAVGALLAGFALPELLGFRASYGVAIVLNLVIGAAAWLLSRRTRPEPVVEPAPPPGVVEEPAANAVSGVAGLSSATITAIAFLSGFLALGLEVMWTRMLAQVLNNSVYSFAAILVTFLIALALGSGLANLLGRRRQLRPAHALAALGALSWLLVVASGHVLVGMTGGLSELVSHGGWTGYVGRVFGLAAVVMLLPGAILGTIYPYLLKASEAHARGTGRTIGRLATFNSVGGILGSLLAGFVLLGQFGLWSSLRIIGSGYLLLAVVAWLGCGNRRAWLAGTAATAAGAALLAVAAPRLPIVRVDADGGERLVQAWEGRHGTVAVIDHDGDRFLKLDNHYALGSALSADSERRQAQLPLFVLPMPSSVFFLGLGTGITAGGALDFPVKRVVTCELVPEVVTAARVHFAEHVNGLFSDPRSRVVVEDGRHFLTGTPDRYDLLISDLFVPWQAGTGSLYTREHFTTCRDRLAPGGHFVQWIAMGQVSRAEFDILVRTLLEVFPHVTAWRGEFVPQWPTLGLICSTAPQQVDPALVRANLAHVIEDRAPERVTDSDVLPWLFYAGNLGVCAPLFARARVNTDDHPIIEYGAPRTQQEAIGSRAAWLTGDALMGLFDEMFAFLPPERDPYLARCAPEQIAYIRAGGRLQAVATHVQGGRVPAAAVLYREFLKVIPLDVFPGLADR